MRVWLSFSWRYLGRICLVLRLGEVAPLPQLEFLPLQGDILQYGRYLWDQPAFRVVLFCKILLNAFPLHKSSTRSVRLRRFPVGESHLQYDVELDHPVDICAAFVLCLRPRLFL